MTKYMNLKSNRPVTAAYTDDFLSQAAGVQLSIDRAATLARKVDHE